MGRRLDTNPARPTRALVAAGCAVLLLVGCREDADATSGPGASPGTTLGQRVFQPSPGLVRAVPPHGIQAAGVGPYQLGAELRDVLSLLPHGPRIELIDIDGVGKYSLVRAENDTIMVGVEPAGKVTFVTVLGADIAKNQDGVAVGTPRESLANQIIRDPGIIRDPRALAILHPPNATYIVDDDKVAAIVLRRAQGSAPPSHPTSTDALSGARAAEPRWQGTHSGLASPQGSAAKPSPCNLAQLRSQSPAAPPQVAQPLSTPTLGCVFGKSPDLVVASKDQITVFGGEEGRWRKLHSVDVPHLRFAETVDLDGDDRHEIIAVTEERGRDFIAPRVLVWRGGDGGRLVKLAEEEVVRIDRAAVGWIGANLDDVDLLIEAEVTGGGLRLGGLFVNHASGRVSRVIPLAPRVIAVASRTRASGEPPPSAAVDSREKTLKPPAGRTPAGTSKKDAGSPSRGRHPRPGSDLTPPSEDAAPSAAPVGEVGDRPPAAPPPATAPPGD